MLRWFELKPVEAEKPLLLYKYLHRAFLPYVVNYRRSKLTGDWAKSSAFGYSKRN